MSENKPNSQSKLPIEIVFLLIAGLLMIPTYLMVVEYYCQSSNGDSANWLQAFVAILTLLAVVYGSIKAALIAKTTEEISKKSIIVSERASVNNLLSQLAFNSNKFLDEYKEIRNKADLLRGEKDLHPNGEEYRFRENIISEMFKPIGKDGYISRFVTNINKSRKIIESCEIRDDLYYKNIFNALLDTSCITELVGQKYLNEIVSEFGETRLCSFGKHADALRKNYEDAREFLSLKEDPDKLDENDIDKR